MIVLEQVHAPDLRRIAGGGTAQAPHRQVRDARPLEGIAARHLGGDLDRLGIAGMAHVNAVHAAIQQLLDHPAVGPHIGFVQTDDAGLHEHRRRAMAAAGRTAIHQSAHEFAQGAEIQRAMLHLHIDGVQVGARHLQALDVGIYPGSHAPMAVIDGLAVFPQFNRLVDAAGLVVQVHAGRLGVGMNFFIAAHRDGLARLRRRGCCCDAGRAGQQKIALLDVHDLLPIKEKRRRLFPTPPLSCSA